MNAFIVASGGGFVEPAHVAHLFHDTNRSTAIETGSMKIDAEMKPFIAGDGSAARVALCVRMDSYGNYYIEVFPF